MTEETMQVTSDLQIWGTTTSKKLKHCKFGLYSEANLVPLFVLKNYCLYDEANL